MLPATDHIIHWLKLPVVPVSGLTSGSYHECNQNDQHLPQFIFHGFCLILIPSSLAEVISVFEKA